MKTLLAILNSTADAKDFVKYVAELATDLMVNLKIMYIENPATYPIGASGVHGLAAAQVQSNLKSRRRNITDKMMQLIDNLKQHDGKEININFSTDIGLKHHIVKRLVEQNEIHMVALQGDDHEQFWGQSSHIMDVIHHATCPVWVVPTIKPYNGFKEIIYATDFKEEDILTLKKLILLTIQFSPQITALHFTDNENFEDKVKSSGFSELLKEKTAYNAVNVTTLKEKGNKSMAEMLQEYAQNKNADLIVLLQENKNFLERLFTSHSTDKIMKETDLPILVFHEENAEVNKSEMNKKKSKLEH